MEYTRIYGTGKHSEEYISFEADPDILLHDYDQYEKYVKGIEAMVRGDDRYKHYIGKLRAAGFDRCAILGDVVKKGGDKVKLEMHHGPIFNLFDYADILLKYHLRKQDLDSITTFDIADELLTCHENDWIMLVGLNQTAHKGAHINIFIDIKSTVGRIDKFIEHYYLGMEEEHFDMIRRYIKEYNKVQGTIDKGLFETSEKLKNFK